MTNYLLAILLTMTLGFGYSTYHLVGKVAVYESEQLRLNTVIADAEDNARKAVDSCKITSEVVFGVNSENRVLSDERTGVLETLAKVTNPTIQVIKYEVVQKPTEAPTKYADSSRLSPELMRVLDAAYCSGDKDNSACTSK